MKIQDIAFFLVLIGLLFLRKPKILVAAGLACYVMAVPLYAMWIFFTAERLIFYGSAFILVGTIGIVLNRRV